MSVFLHGSADLPEAGTYGHWLAVTGTAVSLDVARKLPDLGRRLEREFDGIREDWWRLGRELAAEPTGDLAHAPTCAAYGSDFGLMLAWGRLAERLAAESEATLVVCDDPWLFRHIAAMSGVKAGRAPRLCPVLLRLRVRGYLSRMRVAMRAAMATVLPRTRGKSALLVYGHPRSTADGHDAYFGGLMTEQPALVRLLHTDCPVGRARQLAGDGRTASLHAWGNPWFALTLPFVRWRPSSGDWLVRRAAEIEGGGGAHAMTRWQRHCQERWLADTKPACIAWPWENHPWERSFVRAARRAGVRTVGYQHTDVGPHQFNMATASNPDGLHSIPDRLLLNGAAYREQLLRWGIPEDRLVIGGAFRIARFGKGHFDPAGPVFVALSAIAAVSTQMMRAVRAATGAGRVFLVKDHPMYPFALEETDDVRRTGKTIPESPGISAVFFGTGTSGIEGVLAGVPTFRLLPDDRVGIDTMPEGLTAVSVTADGLGAALDANPEPPDVTWDDLFSDVDPAVWREELRLSP